MRRIDILFSEEQMRQRNCFIYPENGIIKAKILPETRIVSLYKFHR